MIILPKEVGGMFKCLIKKEDQLTPEEFKQLENLLVPLFSFSYHFTQSYQKNHTLYYSSKPQWRFLLCDDGELVGSLSIVKRAINKPFPIVIGGVGNVGIKKSHQGQGLALLMLKKAHEFMKDKKINISLLFCTKERQGLYLKSGYIKTEKPVLFFSKGQQQEEPLALFLPLKITSEQTKDIQKNGLNISQGTW